jgi:hypothetical protein
MCDFTSMLNYLCYGPCAPIYAGNVYACEHDFVDVEVSALREAVLRALEVLPRYTAKPNPFSAGEMAEAGAAAAAAAVAAEGAVVVGKSGEDGGASSRSGKARNAVAPDAAGDEGAAPQVVVSDQPGSAGALVAGADPPFKRIGAPTQLRPEEAFVGGAITSPETGVFGRYRTKARQFTDDLSFTFVVRDGGRVTMRAVSASRVGVSDLGQNYRNIRHVLDAIKKDGGFRSRTARYQPYVAYASACPCSCRCFCCCTVCSR